MQFSAILALLPGVIKSIDALSDFVGKSLTTLKQAKELTPEQEAQRDELIAQTQKKSWWQED